VRVVVTPVGGWSGLYIEEQTQEGFTVRSGAGDPNVTFNWIAIGRRKGYEERPELNLPYGDRDTSQGSPVPLRPR
jgi:hypothetical protein